MNNMNEALKSIISMLRCIENEIHRLTNIECNDKTHFILKNTKIKAIDLGRMLEEARDWNTIFNKAKGKV